MADEQEIMCKLESIKEIRYVCFVPHQFHGAAFSSGERRSCSDLQGAIVRLRERKPPPGFTLRAENTFFLSREGASAAGNRRWNARWRAAMVVHFQGITSER